MPAKAESKPSWINKQTVITAITISVLMSVVSIFNGMITKSCTGYIDAPKEIIDIKKDIKDLKEKELEEIRVQLKELDKKLENTAGTNKATQDIIIQMLKKMESQQ